MNNTTKLYLLFLLLFFIYISGIVLSLLYSKYILSYNNKFEITNFSSNKIPDNLKYRHLEDTKLNIIIFESEISRNHLTRIKTDNYKLIIYKLACKWYKVYFNGILIGSNGVSGSENNNINNSLMIFDLDKNLFKDRNLIQIEVAFKEELGLLSYPVYISDGIFAGKIFNWINNILASISIITIGKMCFTFFELISLFFLTGRKKYDFLFYAISSLLMGIYITDYLNLYNLSISILDFKKLTCVSLLLSVSFISFAFYKAHKSIILLVSAILLALASIFIIIFAGNLLILAKLNNLFTLLIVINISAWIYISLRNFNKSTSNKIFFWLSILTLALISINLSQNFFYKKYFLNTGNLNIYSLFFFSVVILILIIRDFLILNNQIKLEIEKSNQFYNKAIKDQMTGCYNHGFITNLLNGNETDYILIMFDIDNFKPINDNFGHQTGDTVIKYVASNILNSVRQSDYVGRYGGDEFIAVLIGCKVDEAVKIAETVRTKVRKPDFASFDITLSIGIYSPDKNETGNEIIEKVDKALYISKKTGKDKITLI